MSTVNSHEHHYAHHFKNADHEFVTSKQGVWLFMVTEILMFGGLFVAFFIYHNMYPDMFAEGAKQLDWRMGFTNTLVLIFSSFTMALGIHFIQKGQNRKATWCLVTTLLCAAIFMVIKYFEYVHKFHLGFFPGKYLDVAHVGAEHANLGLYFGFYYCMTGMHGIHVLIGMALIVWVLIRNMRGDFHPHYYTPVEGVGIFWHIVDLIWIFLFPLLYLVG
ncbi:MAG TPA: cytochrome c oxidase subunit 3 family protein [Pseudobdellovibrionaceae bacterium]|nr:cytochrome c oxidase subunit 3 family protein [Pseudobdellovibrionaceae bacterium]